MLSPPHILKIRRRRRKLFILLDADNCDGRIYLHFCIQVIDQCNAMVHFYMFSIDAQWSNTSVLIYLLFALSSRSSFCVNCKAALLCFLGIFFRGIRPFSCAACDVSAFWRLVLAGRKSWDHYPLRHHLRQTTMASSIKVWQFDESKPFFEILTC